jgi:hypothetical protein
MYLTFTFLDATHTVFITKEDRNLNSHPEPTKCILIGYNNQLKAFQCYKLQIEKVVISWNVVFDKEYFEAVTEDCQEGSLTFDDIDFLPNDKLEVKATEEESNTPTLVEQPTTPTASKPNSSLW